MYIVINKNTGVVNQATDVRPTHRTAPGTVFVEIDDNDYNPDMHGSIFTNISDYKPNPSTRWVRFEAVNGEWVDPRTPEEKAQAEIDMVQQQGVIQQFGPSAAGRIAGLVPNAKYFVTWSGNICPREIGSGGYEGPFITSDSGILLYQLNTLVFNNWMDSSWISHSAMVTAPDDGIIMCYMDTLADTIYPAKTIQVMRVI